MSSYKELNELRRQGGKFFNKGHNNLTPDEMSQLRRINRLISITEADLRRKAFERQDKIKQAIQDKEDNNIMNLLRRGE